MKLRLTKNKTPFYILIFFGLVLLFMGIMNHYYFRTVTYDYGNYNFAFWDYSHFRISPMPTYPGNFLQDHYSFTLMFFIPVFWLLNWLTGTYTLILIQYSMLMLAAWFTYKLIILKTSNKWLGTGVLLYYFLLLGRFTTFSCDVNLAVISACFIPVFLYLFEIKKYAGTFVILILALLSRENIPLWFIFIFIVLIIQHRKEKKAVILSVAGIFLSLFYFILLFKVLIPGIETDEKHFTLFNYSALGANPGEAFLFAIKNPVETIKLFFINHLNDPSLKYVKAEFYFVYLISGGFVLFLRPKYFIWFIPIVAQKMLNDSFIRWGISTYYSIEVVTLLPVSVFLTLSSLKSKKLQNILTIVVCISTLSMTVHKLDRSNVVIPWTLNPSKEKLYYKGFYTSDYDLRKTHKLLKSIPKDAKVSASDHLYSHLAQRPSIYLFPDVKDADYIVFSVFDNYFMNSHMENERKRNEYLHSADWEIIQKEFPVFLLKKKRNEKQIEEETIKLGMHSDTILCNFETVDTLKNEVYFNDDLIAAQAKRTSHSEFRSENTSLLLDNKNPYGTAIQPQEIENIEYLSVSVYYFSEAGHANIVSSCGSRFYYFNGVPSKTENDTGKWKKLELSFWVPQQLDLTQFKIYLWNSGQEPVYFDDLQIIKRYRNPE
ncbi:MAG: DUF2079 domain-containing protein [Draconibacterium sp.]